jgi:hypothetical protein
MHHNLGERLRNTVYENGTDVVHKYFNVRITISVSELHSKEK